MNCYNLNNVILVPKAEQIFLTGQRASRKIRKFKIPKFNFDADEYFETIDLSNIAKLTKPPLLMSFNDDELKDIMDNPINHYILKLVIRQFTRSLLNVKYKW